MQVQLRHVVSQRNTSSKALAGYVFSSHYPRLIVASKDILIDLSTSTNAARRHIRTSAKIRKVLYVGDPPTILAFLDDGDLIFFAEVAAELQLVHKRNVATADRPVTLAHAALFGNLIVFCKAESPSIWCLKVPLKGSPPEPYKLRSDIGGDQQSVNVIDGTFARLRGKVTTNAKARPSPVIAVTTHPRLPLVAAAYGNGIIRIWDANRHEQRSHLNIQPLMNEQIVALAFHPHFQVVVTCTTLGRIISFQVPHDVYKHGDEPVLPSSKTRDRKRRFCAMCFAHSDPLYLVLLTSSKRVLYRLVNRKGTILTSTRFPKSSSPLTARNEASLSYQMSSLLDDLEDVPVGLNENVATVSTDPVFGLFACTFDKSGSVYIFQNFSDGLPIMRTPYSPGLDFSLSLSDEKFTGELDVDTESLFVYRNTLFSYTLGSEKTSKLCRLPAGDVHSFDVARDENGYCIGALIYYHGDNFDESTEIKDAQEVDRYVICSRRGETDYWNVSDPSEGSTGCFLGAPGRQDRVLTVANNGAMISISSFAATSTSLTTRQNTNRGVHRFKLPTGRVNRVFRAPFCSWSSILIHDVRGRCIGASKNSFERSGLDHREPRGRNKDLSALYTMDTDTAIELLDSEIVIDVRWQKIAQYEMEEDFLGAILTNKRIYFVHHVLQPISRFEFDSISRCITPFSSPCVAWAGPSLILLHGNTLFTITLDGSYDVIAGLSNGECATSMVACLPDRIVYAAPTFHGSFGSVSVRSRPYGGISPSMRGMLSLAEFLRLNRQHIDFALSRICEKHDVSQGSTGLANYLKSHDMPAIAYLLAMSEHGKLSMPALKRATFLVGMGEIRGALDIAEEEYAKLPGSNSFHRGTELYRHFQRILNMGFILGDFEVCSRCAQVLGRRGTLSAFVDGESGYDALRAAMDTVRNSDNKIIMNKLRVLIGRSENSSIASMNGLLPSRAEVKALRKAVAPERKDILKMGSVDDRDVFIRAVTPQDESLKGAKPAVDRVRLKTLYLKSIEDRLEVYRNVSTAFNPESSTSHSDAGPASGDYVEFIEDGPRDIDISKRPADNTKAIDENKAFDSSDDEFEHKDAFLNPEFGKGAGAATISVESMLPQGGGQLSQATIEGAADTETKLAQSKTESHAVADQMAESTRELALAQRQVQPTGFARPEIKAADLLIRASEKMRQDRFKSAQKDVENAIRALARGVERGVSVVKTLLTQLVHYRFACKLCLAMTEISESAHVDTVAGRMTYAQLATACTTLSLQNMDRVDALLRAVDCNLALGNFGTAAQGLRIMKEIGISEDMRDPLRKRYTACQVRGFVDTVPILPRIICFTSLKAVVPGSPTLGCTVCVAVFALDSGLTVGSACEYCQMGRVVMR